MHEDRLFAKILESKNVNYDIFCSPIGEIFVFGDTLRIQSIKFIHKNKLKNYIASQVKKNQTEEMTKIFSYLQDYFSNDTTMLKKYKISILSEDIIKNKTSGNSSNDEIIHLDLSSYSTNEIKVYRNLQKFKSGKTLSYKELGEISGFQNAARFIGNTMAKNNFPIIIPCHRVVKSNGDMGNYSGGIYIKKFLLNLENGINP